jgi:hypothetical protein
VSVEFVVAMFIGVALFGFGLFVGLNLRLPE